VVLEAGYSEAIRSNSPGAQASPRINESELNRARMIGYALHQISGFFLHLLSPFILHSGVPLGTSPCNGAKGTSTLLPMQPYLSMLIQP
jgi:hypothetical protein